VIKSSGSGTKTGSRREVYGSNHGWLGNRKASGWHSERGCGEMGRIYRVHGRFVEGSGV
jgi:hypothetical protein